MDAPLHSKVSCNLMKICSRSAAAGSAFGVHTSASRRSSVVRISPIRVVLVRAETNCATVEPRAQDGPERDAPRPARPARHPSR